MLSEKENNYVEKWTTLQSASQLQKRIILSLIGVVGILALTILIVGRPTPFIVEKKEGVFTALSVVNQDIKPTKEAVSQMVIEFVKVRYEWPQFAPEQIIKNLEPLTTEGFRSKLLTEFGSKTYKNEKGASIEQSVSRIKPEVSEKAVLASFDRVLRINDIPVIAPTEISLMLVEGPKTALNPIGLYINGLMEHEGK